MTMARGRIREKDLGWNRVKRAIREADGAGVKVGVLSAAGDHDSASPGSRATVAEVAAANEFGYGVPERPAFRQAIDGNTDRLRQSILRASAEVLLGTDVRRALNPVGLLAQTVTRQQITDLRDPPNSERTIQRKGSSNPLIDTGQLRQSVTWEVVTGSDAKRARRGSQGGA